MTIEEEQIGGQTPEYLSRRRPEPKDCDHAAGRCWCDDDGETAANPPPTTKGSP